LHQIDEQLHNALTPAPARKRERGE
jgi:hypothetical protein